MWPIENVLMVAPKISKCHDKPDTLHPEQCSKEKKQTIIFCEVSTINEQLTSVRPCMNRIVHNMVTLSNDIAPIIRRFRNDDKAIDVPKIFVAGKIDAKKPAGICVIK